MCYPKPSEPRPIYGRDFEPMRGIYLPDTRISELIKQGYKGIYDARTGILTMYKEEDRMNNKEPQEAYADFLNDIERVAEKHGWNIGIHDNKSDNKTFPRVELTFVPAIGYDAQFRKFGYDCEGGRE